MTAKKDNPTHIKDLVPDPTNRRKHTPRNVGMIVDALHKVGAGRSIVIDETNTVLAGNATLEAAGEAGITDLRVIEAKRGPSLSQCAGRGCQRPRSETWRCMTTARANSPSGMLIN